MIPIQEDKMQPKIIVTMGDPSGIGPEIVIKAFNQPEVFSICRPCVIGDLHIMQKTAKQLKFNVRCKTIPSPEQAEGKPGVIDVIDLNNVDEKHVRPGKISKEAGRASLEYIHKAVQFALKGEGEAIVTAPINKKAISLAGSPHIGHTELIADLCKTREPLTMFWVKGARIFFLTRHLSLEDAIKRVKKDELIAMILKVNAALNRIGLPQPRIAIAALNPHAGDRGLLGMEEETEIAPAITLIQTQGLNVDGPIPADSVFHQALMGKYDGVISLYHDQGHIAAKTLDFYGTISVTLGLPFIRTSVDHGTAHDIAGQGRANSRSLEEAIKVAAQLCLDTG